MGNWYTDPVNGEVSIEDIRQRAENGEFHEWNFTPFEYQESGYEDIIEELKKYKAVDYLNLDEKRKKALEAGNTVEAEGYKQQMEKMVEDVLSIYRSKNIFPIQYFSELGVMDEIEKCIAYKAKFDGNTVSCVSGDTEYFNGKEWKRIDEYVEGDMVLQYNTDGTGELVKPLDYIHYQSDEPFYTQNPDVTVTGSRVSYLTEKMTGSHNIVCYNYKSNNIRNRDLVKVTLSDLFDLGVETGGIVFIPTGCRYSGSIHEDYTVLLDVFYSVIANKYNGNTYTYIKNGNVCLSDKCFLLDLESRRLLLSFFGISRELFDLKKNTLRACGGCSIPVVSCVFLSDDAIKSINGVLQLTLTGCYLDRDDCDSLSCMLFDYLDILTEKKCYNVSYEKDKYCFTVPSGMLLLRREGVVFITGNCGAGIGTGLCRWLFPNLFDTPSAHDLTKKDAETQYKKFLNDEYLKRAIKFCYSYKDGCPTPTSVEGGLRLVGSAPSNFRPMNAKAVYERFCPKGGTIYDFCCVDDETEFFNGKKWKSLADYVEGDMVLQYNEDGTAELVNPIEYIHYQSDDPFYEYIGKNFNSCLTGNHDIVYRKRLTRGGDIKGLSKEVYKIKQSEILNKDFRGRIPLTCVVNGDISVNEDILRLAIAVQADGTIDDFNSGRIRFCFTKKSKIERISYLLDKCGIPYSNTITYSGSNTFKDMHYFYFNCKEITNLFKDCSKTFPSEWYMLSSDCRKAFLDEVFYWDGINQENVTSGYGVKSKVREYFSTNKENAELVWYILNTTEGSMGGTFIRDDNRYSNITYNVYAREKSPYSEYNYKNGYNIVNKRDKYCFVVPSHMLVLRRKRKMFVTGNCGFGGRMLGALSSKNNYRYVGTDPCTETMYHLHELGEYIEMVTGREDSYELHCCGSEVFRGPANSIDFAFSSPPYFNLEVYSDEPTQCYNKFPKLEEWLEGYVRATIRNIYHMLKPGHFYAVNIADFKVGGGGEVAYVDEWKRISAEEGMPLFDTVYLGVTARAGSAEQAAGELKKENIMIFKKPL